MIGVALGALLVSVGASKVRGVLSSSPQGLNEVAHSGESGIWGTVFFTCGGPAGGPPTCGPQPIEAPEEVLLEVRREGDGRLVSEFTSSESGEFEVELLSGNYQVFQSRKLNMRRPPCFVLTAPIAVPRDGWVHLDLACDNGVR
jgi:hypothetical protein